MNQNVLHSYSLPLKNNSGLKIDLQILKKFEFSGDIAVVHNLFHVRNREVYQ